MEMEEEDEEVREQARKDAEYLWKNELESSFKEKFNESLLETMKKIDFELMKYDKKINAILKGIEQKPIDKKHEVILNPIKIDLREVKKTKTYVKLNLLNDANPLINLVIQSLSNIQTFNAYYLNPQKEGKILSKSKANPNGVFLGPSYLKLLKDMWGDQKEDYFPSDFHEALKALMRNDYQSNNSGYIMEFMLNQLYLELNLDNNLHINLNYFKDNDQLPNNKIFNSSYTLIKTKKFCSFCKNLVEKYLSASPVINIFLDENNGKSNQFNLENNLKELLIERGKDRIFDNCPSCITHQENFVSKYIYETSEIVVFHIDRKNDPNHRISLSYGQIMKILGKEYKLITVIQDLTLNYDGSCLYMAYIRSFCNQKWFSYDNKNIKLNNNENELFDDRNTSLLIYSLPNSN